MFFRKIYSSWKETQKEKYASMLQHFPEIFSGRVLDIGSGPGFLKEFLREKGVSADIVSLDVEKPADVMADGSKLPFKNETFDAIISIDAMHLISGMDFSRVAKPEGLALFGLFFNKQNYHERKSLLQSKLGGFGILKDLELHGKENEYVVLARKK